MKRAALLYFLLTIAAIATELPKEIPGFVWRDFPKEHVSLQVPESWKWAEKDKQPAKTLAISPSVTPAGSYDTGLTLNAMICRSEKEWRNAYLSSLKRWADTSKEIHAQGKPTLEKTFQDKNTSGEIVLQVMIVEGDMTIPEAPHPKEKYRVRTVVRAFPAASVVYVYSFGALAREWDEAWKTGETMLESIVFHAARE